MIPISHSIPSEEEPVQQLVLQIIQVLVDDVASARVESSLEDGVTTLNVNVALSDTGKIIGKQGRTARSLRTIISAPRMKRQHRYALNMEGGDNGNPVFSSYAS